MSHITDFEIIVFSEKNVNLLFFILFILIFATDVSPGEGGTSYIVGKLRETLCLFLLSET